MSYLVFARKYRPLRLDDVVGQERIARTLRHALERERVAHAYLFCGPRGVGKTSMARILARCLNCSQAREGPTTDPCGSCEICESIASGSDIDVIEIDGASNNRVDEVRELRENVRYAAVRSRFKIYIIDEVHMLTTPAFNALLKTLEEPPRHVKFVFATTEPHAIPETIRSRCQIFEFQRISEAEIATRLARICELEGVEAQPGALSTIAALSQDAMRDALSLLDQAISYHQGILGVEDVEAVAGLVPRGEWVELLDRILDGDQQALLSRIEKLCARSGDVASLLDQLLGHLRDLLVLRSWDGEGAPVIGTAEMMPVLQEQAARLSPESLFYLSRLVSDVRDRASRGGRGRILLELALLKAATMGVLPPIQAVLEAIDRWRSLGPPAAREAVPAPAPAPDGGPAAEPSDARPPEDDRWERLLHYLATRSLTLQMVLRGSRWRIEGDSLSIRPGARSGFHRAQLEDRRNLEFLERGVREVFGRPLRIRLVTEGREGEDENAAPSGGGGGSVARPEDAGEDPFVQRSLDAFDGEIVSS